MQSRLSPPNQQELTKHCEKPKMTRIHKWQRADLFVGTLFVSLLICQFIQTSPVRAASSSSIDTRITANHSQQVGDLVAIGAISLIPSSTSPPTATIYNGRLIDRLASPLPNAVVDNKLDYIIEFMQKNKLTKFCDLLTSERPEITKLARQLNLANEFTIFVPTNEALLLTNHLDELKTQPDELSKFLRAHITPELIIPRPNQLVQAQSLSGGPLRISSLVNSNSSSNQSPTASESNLMTLNKLDIIVNGANVIPGHSYALQEPNNSSRTHAIVHLVDRALYPSVSSNLMDKVRQLAPTMARYIEAANDAIVSEMLEQQQFTSASSQKLATLFLPNEEAFRATPSRLLDQLDTNRTFLVEFLRTHLIDGFYYSNQLVRASRSKLLAPATTTTISGARLEFDTKTLQSRSIVLVNSIPIVDPDVMATNGILHIITRPIFERNLLDSCNCGSEMLADKSLWANSIESSSSGNLVASAARSSNDNSNWFRGPFSTRSSSSPAELTALATSSRFSELEREELPTMSSSSTWSRQKLRSERSDNVLVARNNRDFYRPSPAPANLLLVDNGQQQSKSNQVASPPATGVLLQKPEQATVNIEQPAVSVDSMFERYKVVLNATSRQRMREQQLASPPANHFSYDLPLGTAAAAAPTAPQTSSFTAARRPQQILVPDRANNSLKIQLDSTDQLAPAATRGVSQKQMLRFQPEDARDPLPGNRLVQSAKESKLQPAYDMFSSNSRLRPTATGGKSLAGGSFNGCAFYDSDCKRLMSRLVRLPPQIAAIQAQPSRTVLTSANFTSSQQQKISDPLDSQQHLDSTFGESTDVNQSDNSTSRAKLALQEPKLNPLRGSPLNQPLPPWSDEDHRAGGLPMSHWRAHDAELTRIQQFQPGVVFTSESTKSSAKTGRMPSAQVLFVPVKLLQDTQAFNSGQLNITGSTFSSPERLLAALNPAQVRFSNQKSGSTFSSQQFHTPTPYSVSLATTHMPPIFRGQSSRLTNFSTSENLSPDAGFDDPPAPTQRPTSFFRQQQQQQLDNTKQARKIVQVHTSPSFSQQQDNSFGDISVTSARLRQNQTGQPQGLVIQASNQSPDVATNNFVRSVNNENLLSTGAVEDQPASPNPSDFFQNRTIAEIMDDSGLRIDGQQVTFVRMKECLTSANLLSLVSQVGNSLTVFMPTDSAYQRLVQQQSVAHQHDRSDSSRTLSARLTDPTRRHQLLPLVARLPASSRLATAPSSSGEVSSTLDVSDRLDLDCAAPQVRQMLLDHLSARLVTPRQLQSDTTTSSLSGRKLLLSSVPDKKIVVVDGQPVIAATRAKNGMVYVINKFLNLTQQVPNVADLLEAQPNLTTFHSYMRLSGLLDRLRREPGPITVLAPTNEAFDQLSQSARQLINTDPASLQEILLGHVVEGAQFGKLISLRNQLKTINPNQKIDVQTVKPNSYLLNDQQTSIKLVGTAGNGLVNSIDRLIVPSWLKTATAAAKPTQTPTVASSTPGGEFEVTNIRNQTNLSNQPLRFRDNGRLTSPSDGNSFLLTGNREIEGLPNLFDSNLLDNKPLDPLNDGFSSPVTPKSPFMRIANNLLNSTTAPRLSSSDLAVGSANVSKNMKLIEKLANLMQARKFVKYLMKSRLSELLKPDMNYVILVPTDQAIERLPKQIVDLLDRDIDRLTDLVQFHVLDTTFEYINTIPDGSSLNTLNEKDIIFNWHRNNTVLTASGAVVLGGIQEDNMALLVVDRVLYPTPGNLLSIVAKSPILSNFTSLIKQFNLEQQLTLAGPFTLFAPSDFAFNQLNKSDLDFLQRNKEVAKRFLLRHLSQPAVFTASIALSNSTKSIQDPTTRLMQTVPVVTISNLLGEDLTLKQKNDYFSVNDINFSYADVAATNGNVHVIDGFL